MSFQRVDRCRSCDAPGLQSVLDLGSQPLANALRSVDDRAVEPRYPLELLVCTACTLVQLSGTIPPGDLFDTYNYFSSYSRTMVEAMGRLAARTVGERSLGPSSLVVEVASNDGYLLTHYAGRGVPVLGIEPAANVADVAVARGIPTLREYFNPAVAERLVAQGQRADVLHANNVMAHVPDLNGFVEAIRIVLAEDGVALIETPHLVAMVDGCLFDTIYHEHVFYYSLTAVERLVARHGLRVADVERIPVHGGSLRIQLRRDRGQASAAVGELLAEEAARGVDSIDYYRGFAARVAAAGRSLTTYLERRRSEGARVAGYGAAAKATVLLNHFGIGPRLVEYVVDRSPHKQGRLIPGVNIPVHPTSRLEEEQPDDLLILVWNLADEVIAQEAAHRRRGGRFVLPLPEVRIA